MKADRPEDEPATASRSREGRGESGSAATSIRWAGSRPREGLLTVEADPEEAVRGGAGRSADPGVVASEMTRRSRSNFYYAFLLLPRAKREAIFAVYALSRAIDDAVDEAASPDEARERLEAWADEVGRLAPGPAGPARAPAHPLTRALARARERFPIPIESVRALLDGARTDLEHSRFDTFEDLRAYCEKVASSIGLMCIEIFGYWGSRTRDYAIELGIALQLTNILRDLASDARRGRLYLPLEDLARFAVREEDLLAGRRTPEVLALLSFEAERARAHYRAAEAALDPRDRRALLAAEVMRRIYRAILAKVERSGFDVFGRRIGLSRARRATIAATSWLRSFA